MSTMKQKDIRPAPSLIEFKGMRFLITDRPSDVTIQAYLQVSHLNYDTAPLVSEGIEVRDLAYDDGTFPPANVVDDWFEILRDKAAHKPEAAVAVHCVAGLGRAPVMVALALIELGMKYEEAVENIRDKRRGAINAKQLSYLEKYKPKSRLKKNGHKNSCCVQ
ncbi:Protein tyrosine phosphatase type IVA 3 [Eumeta japonica]|uniref:Protein tyrosine phosphatase type IVA 3 n=1 Tax=Eumeta variegata TaxID=151549 RepID=A0A4C1WBU1_EUMVA|nr:Protein tyrosine phosphatase type IVA 3 [Eumeta japonica]